MIRVRAGRSWLRDAATLAALRAGPRLPPLFDSLRIVADGVCLNAGLEDEPILETCHALARALWELCAGRRPSAHVELAQPGVAMVLGRDRTEALLLLVRRGQRGGAILAEARTDLLELAAAAHTCVRELLSALADVEPALLKLGPCAKLSRIAARLERTDALVQRRVSWPSVPFERTRPPRAGALDVRHRIIDREGRIARYRRGRADLFTLLDQGWVELTDERGVALARSTAPAFLALEDLLHLARQAASPGGNATAPLGSTGRPLRLENGELRLGRERLPALRFARAAAVCALAFAGDVVGQNPEQHFNPFLAELCTSAQCLVRRLDELEAGAAPGLGRAQKIRGPRPQAPLSRGTLRRAAFSKTFQARLPFAVRHLQPLGDGLLAVGDRESALLCARTGTVRWARRLPLAATGSSALLLGADDTGRLMRLDPREGQPLWFHDGEARDVVSVLARTATPQGELAVVRERPAALAGLYATSGACRWRLSAPLAQRLAATAAHGKAFASTSLGQIYAIDLRSGAVRYRIQASHPCAGPPLRAGRSLFQLAEGDDQDHLLALDAATGQLRADLPLALRESGPLAALRGYVATIGHSPGSWVLTLHHPPSGAIAAAPLPLAGPRPALLATPHGFLCTAASGEAALIDLRAEIIWHQREAAQATAATLEPLRVRGLALIPCEAPLVCDLSSHRVVAQLPALPGLCALAADARLGVFLAEDEGEIIGYRLGTYLAVV